MKSPIPSLPDYDPSWNLHWVYPDIHPSWTWPGYEGTSLEVTVYSECEQVELFLNDASLGTKATSIANEYTATWNVNYAPGELKAVGYVSSVPQAEWILNTAGAAASIQLSADKSTIAADGSSLCYVTAELLDGSGNPVYDPNEDKLISFDINGPGRLAGVGNANPCGTESFQRPQRMTFRGRCVAVIESTLRTGTITVTASSGGLTSDSVVVQTTGGVTSNTAPVATDDSYSIYSGETLDVWLYGVTSNDTDAELDPLSAVLVTGVSDGNLALNPDGTFEYTPAPGFEGSDSFTYKANDGDANSNVATVFISVESKVPPAGWWKFDEGSGSTANNSGTLGGGNDGTLVNMDDSDWVQGRVGPTALDFDGTDDYVSVPALNLNSNTVTITAWIRRDGTQAETYTGIVISRDGSTSAGISFGKGSGGFGDINHELAYNWNDMQAAWEWHSGLIVPDNKWTFVALVVEPEQATLYMDEGGTLQSATNTLSHGTEEFDGITRIGHDVMSSTRFFKGRIDDVRIYRRSLSPSEIEELASYVPDLIDDTADSDIAVSGTVSGSYVDTRASDNVYESIEEIESVGGPTTRYSYLEHKWTINVTGNDIVTFNVEAYHTANAEGDDFVFAYSTDDSNYTDMLTVTKTVDDDACQSYEMPNDISGMVYIRVRDADRTAGNRTLDTIYIDHMYIRSEAAGPAADFNGDDKVNFVDYAELADAWQSSLGQPAFKETYDLHDDGVIDELDLSLFCDEWLAGVGP